MFGESLGNADNGLQVTSQLSPWETRLYNPTLQSTVVAEFPQGSPRAEARGIFRENVTKLYEALDKIVVETDKPLDAYAASQLIIETLNTIVPPENQFKPLNTHLSEVSDYLQSLCSLVTEETGLTDHHVGLLAHAVAPLHDRMKFLGNHQSQLPQDHELIIGNVIDTYFPKWGVPPEDVQFIATASGSLTTVF